MLKAAWFLYAYFKPGYEASEGLVTRLVTLVSKPGSPFFIAALGLIPRPCGICISLSNVLCNVLSWRTVRHM